MTLTEFLLARIAEDDALFNDAVEAEVQRCRADGIPDLTAEEVRAYWLRPKGEGVDEVERAGTEWPRYLAECEAKRALVEYALSCSDIASVKGGSLAKGMLLAATHSLRAIAAVYADHPDYDESWRV